MTVTDQPREAVQRATLASKLHRLARLRESRDRTAADSEDASRAYRSLEAECIEQMVEEEVLSVRVPEVGLFSIASRNYPSVRDMGAFIEWAMEQGTLPNGVTLHPEAQQITVTFDIAPDDEDASKVVLVNGALKLAPIVKRINDHVRDAIDSDQPMPPGVEPNTRFVLSIRRA